MISRTRKGRKRKVGHRRLSTCQRTEGGWLRRKALTASGDPLVITGKEEEAKYLVEIN